MRHYPLICYQQNEPLEYLATGFDVPRFRAWLMAGGPRRRAYDHVTKALGCAVIGPRLTFDQALDIYNPFEDFPPDSAGDIIGYDGSYIERQGNWNILVTFSGMAPDHYSVWAHNKISGELRCSELHVTSQFSTGLVEEDGPYYLDGLCRRQSLTSLVLSSAPLSQEDSAKYVASAANQANRLAFLRGLDYDVSESVRRTSAPNCRRTIVSPLTFNFLNGSLPGVEIDPSKAKLYARQAMERFPGIGVFALAMAGYEESIRNKNDGNNADERMMVAGDLAAICNGVSPVKAFTSLGTHIPNLFTEVSADVLEGLLAGCSSPPLLIKTLDGMHPNQFPSDWSAASFLGRLVETGFYPAALRQKGGWLACPPMERQKLAQLMDYSAWLDMVVDKLSADPEVVHQRLRTLGLRRWMDISDHWHARYAVWFETIEAGGCVSGDEPFNPSWVSLFHAGVVETFSAGGWNITELLTQRDLDLHGLQQQHCVGTYAAACRAGFSRIFKLEHPAEPTLTVEIKLNNTFSIHQCAGPGNSVPAASGVAVANDMLQALNMDLRLADEGDPRIINPACLQRMSAPREDMTYLPEYRLKRLMARVGTQIIEREVARFLPFSFKFKEMSVPSPKGVTRAQPHRGRPTPAPGMDFGG